MKMRKLACKECHELIKVKFIEYFNNSDIECPNCKTNDVINYDAKKNIVILVIGLVIDSLIYYLTSYGSMLLDIIFWTMISLLCFQNINLEKVNWKKIN